ncbi:PLAG1 [Lepeophtheirus salmonis]|uniref:PLAG1 n=1 Tax=Lepeophtheirus salmonis TaxID=72036 RepID=A0A7R8CIG8_LEPSM|nr:PLAG1 [Lepeophtheirus salmonis]CAF2832174.1 PLAG1 [Lepeophtheirus salmonis]
MRNHKLLVIFEKVQSSYNFIKEHLEQYATVEVMIQYGYCLETFESNTTLITELGSQRGESESGTDNSPIPDENLEFSAPSPSEKVYVDEIEDLKDLLLSQGKEYLIDWLQEEIFNVILVKTHAKSKGSVEWKEGVLESIPYYSVFWNEGTLLVPWSIKEESGLKTNNFIMLLKKIGTFLPAEKDKHFPRIPFDCRHKKVNLDWNFAKPKLQNIEIRNEGHL